MTVLTARSRFVMASQGHPTKVKAFPDGFDAYDHDGPKSDAPMNPSLHLECSFDVKLFDAEMHSSTLESVKSNPEVLG